MSDPDQVLERMRNCLCRWEAAGDARAIFLACYATMTRNMLAATVDGQFHDPVWVRRLLAHFASYYFAALDAWDAGLEEVPQVWACAHRAAARSGGPALQQLLLGVNAHINYDLVFATADLLAEEWPVLSQEEQAQRRADYNHVNTIISSTIDEVQTQVLARREPILEIVDVVLGPLDEWVIGLELTHWRDEVWDQALQRIELADAQAREEHRHAVEVAALAWARRLGG